MDDYERKLLIQEEAALQLSASNNTQINQNQIFLALNLVLSDKYDLEWPGDLWDIEISVDEIISHLSEFNFNSLTETITTSDEILPSDFLIKFKVRIKSGGLVWIIYRYDPDPFPSSPHAHETTNNIKLDLSNGKCYKRRKYINTIRKKDLLDIRNKVLKIFKGDLPELEY